MKEKKWISRILAFVCAIVVSASSMELPMIANADTGSSSYEVVDVSAYTGKAAETYTGAQGVITPLTAGQGTLDGIMVDGIFNLSRYSSIFFGSSEHPKNRFQIGVNNGSQLYYQFCNNGVVSGKSESFDTSYAGKDVRMKVGFTFTNKDETAGTADLTINLQIGDSIQRELSISGVKMAEMANQMYVLPNTGTIKMQSLKPQTVVDVSAYTGKAAETYTGAQGAITLLTAGEGTLDGIMVDGIYNLSRYSSIFFGSSEHPKNRFQIGVNNGSQLYYQFCNNGIVSGKSESFDTSYAGKDLRIKVQFTFINKNETAGTADLIINLQIGDSIQRELSITGVKMAEMANQMYVLPNTGTIKIQSLEPQTVVNVSSYTGKPEATYTGAQGAITPLTAGQGTLDGLMVDGIYNLSRYSSIFFGSSEHPKNRFQIGVNNGSQLYYQFCNNGIVSGKSETFDTSFAGKDTRIKVGFVFINKNETAGTADLMLKLNIGDTIARELLVQGVKMAEMANQMYVLPNTGTITIKAAPTEAGEETTPITTVAVGEYTGASEKTYTGEAGVITPLTAGEGTLDGIMIDGIYNMSKYSSIFFGSSEHPKNRFQLRVDNSGNLMYQFANNGIVEGKTETFDSSFTGKDTRIKVSFVFTNKDETAGTADLTINLQIGTGIQREIKVPGVKMADMANQMYVLPNTGTIKITSVVPQTVVDVSSYTGKAEAGYTGAQGVITPLTAGEGTLDGIMIDGIYNISRYSSIFFGSSVHPKNRFQIGVNNGSQLYYQFCNNGVVTGKNETLGTTLTGKDTRIQVGFVFVNENATAGTADLIITLKIGELVEREIEVPGVTMADMANQMYVLPNTGAIAIKSVNPSGGGEGDDSTEVPEGFVPEYEKTMKFTDFGITSDLKVTGVGEAKPNGGDTLSLNKIMVEGTYHFTGEESAVYIGSRGWGGLRFGGAKGGKFAYQFFDNGGQNALHLTALTKEDTGCDLLGADVRIKAGFTILNTEGDKADVIVEVQIGDTYKEIFRVNDVLTKNLIRGMHVYAGGTSTITLKVDAEDLDYTNEPDDKKLTYAEELTFFDLGVANEMVVDNSTGRIRVAGKTLNSVSIEGTYNFVGNCILGFGGDWKGLQIQRAGTDKLLYQYLDVNGKGGVYSKTVSAADVGCALYDEDVKLKVGFIFANEDTEAGTADVTIEVCIGDEYRDVFTVLGVQTANLARWMNLYAVDGNGYTGTKMTLRKPYMEPFDFTEYGFTTNWKEELRLK